MSSFTIVPNEVLENKELSISERMILIALISYKNEEKGFAYPSYKQLKKRSGVKNDSTLIKGLNKLVELKFIKKTVVEGKGTKYHLIYKAEGYYKNIVPPTTKVQWEQNSTHSKSEVPPTTKIECHPLQKYSTTNTNTNTKTKTNYINLAFIDKSIDKVYITKEEYHDLVSKFNEALVNKKILDLDAYITGGKAKSYGSHYKVLNIWINREIEKNPALNNKRIIVNEKIREVFV